MWWFKPDLIELKPLVQVMMMVIVVALVAGLMNGKNDE